MDIAGAQNPPNPSDDSRRAAEYIVVAMEVINIQYCSNGHCWGSEPPNPLDDTERAAENLMLAKEVIIKECTRTVSIVTVFSFIGFCFSFFIRAQWSAVAILTVFRLTVYKLQPSDFVGSFRQRCVILFIKHCWPVILFYGFPQKCQPNRTLSTTLFK